MNWITKIIAAGKNIKQNLHERVTKAEIAKSDWVACCKGPIERKLLKENQWVCPFCSKHYRIKPTGEDSRFKYTFDNGAYEIIKTPMPKDDPLGFQDTKPYKQRLKDARKKTNLDCSMVVATGNIKNIPITAIASDFEFLGASIEAAEGEAFLAAADHAIQNKQPLVVFTAGGGMRMQGGMISLNQMPRMTLAVNEIKKNGLPYIVVLTDPTAGGITASYAMLGDLNLAEPGATVAFAGARVISATVKESLPVGFQKSEYLVGKGQIDLVIERKDIPEKLGILLSILLKKNSAITSEQNETSELSIKTREAS